MRIVYSPDAIRELRAVWRYNAKRYNAPRATEYEAFLKKGIDALSLDHPLGRLVAGRPPLRHMTYRRSARGYGHIVVYRIDPETQTVRVLHVFHTEQKWRGKLDETGP